MERLPVAVDKRAAKRKLAELLTTKGWHENALAACREKEDASGVKGCEWALRIDYSLIRKHCAEHEIELPHDVPPEGEE